MLLGVEDEWISLSPGQSITIEKDRTDIGVIEQLASGVGFARVGRESQRPIISVIERRLETEQYIPTDKEDGLLLAAPFRKNLTAIWNGGIAGRRNPSKEIDPNGTYFHRESGLIRKVTPNFPDRVGSSDFFARRLGMLFEDFRTFKTRKSEKLTDSVWTKTNCSVTPGITDSLAEDKTSSKLIEDLDSTPQIHTLSQAATVIGLVGGDPTRYILSVFIKEAGRSKVRLKLSGTAFPTDADAQFDLDALTIEKGTGALDADIDDANNDGWQKIWVSAESTGTSGVIELTLQDENGLDLYQGDGAKDVLLFGFALEEFYVRPSGATYPTSYVETDDTDITRATDNIQFNNTGQVNAKAAAGTIYIAVTSEFKVGLGNFIFDLRKDPGAVGTGIVCFATPPDGNLIWAVVDNDIIIAFLTSTTTIERGETLILTCVWEENDFRFYINGILEAFQSTGIAPSDILTKIHIGNSNRVNASWHGNLAHFHIYDSAHDTARIEGNVDEIRSFLDL